jgi:manganese-transporting P-type ATPase
MLAQVPSAYSDTHARLAGNGARVLALAYKRLSAADAGGSSHGSAGGSGTGWGAAAARALARDEVERGLVFAGFLAFHCPVKPDSREAIKLLRQSSHRVRVFCHTYIRTHAHTDNSHT